MLEIPFSVSLLSNPTPHASPSLAHEQDQLELLPKIGPKRAASIVEGIASAAAGMSLATLLAGLGIPQVGVRTARDLDRAFEGSLERVEAASVEELMALPGERARRPMGGQAGS